VTDRAPWIATGLPGVLHPEGEPGGLSMERALKQVLGLLLAYPDVLTDGRSAEALADRLDASIGDLGVMIRAIGR